jgi:hypothetical protein
MRTWAQIATSHRFLEKPAGLPPAADRHLRQCDGGGAESSRSRRHRQQRQPGLAERRRQKAGAQQHEARRGQGKKSVGDNVVAAHVTPTTEMLVRID